MKAGWIRAVDLRLRDAGPGGEGDIGGLLEGLCGYSFDSITFQVLFLEENLPAIVDLLALLSSLPFTSGPFPIVQKKGRPFPRLKSVTLFCP